MISQARTSRRRPQRARTAPTAPTDASLRGEATAGAPVARAAGDRPAAWWKAAAAPSFAVEVDDRHDGVCRPAQDARRQPEPVAQRPRREGRRDRVARLPAPERRLHRKRLRALRASQRRHRGRDGGRARRADDLRRRHEAARRDRGRSSRAGGTGSRADDHAGGARRRHVHGLQPGDARRAPVLPDPQPPAGGDPRRGGGGAATAGGGGRHAVGSAADERLSRLRPPDRLRGRRGPLPRAAARAARTGQRFDSSRPEASAAAKRTPCRGLCATDPRERIPISRVGEISLAVIRRSGVGRPVAAWSGSASGAPAPGRARARRGSARRSSSQRIRSAGGTAAARCRSP